MEVKNAWALNGMPNHYVIEKPDGTFAKFYQAPFREITEAELTVYAGHHPEACKGYMMTPSVWRFYGLTRTGGPLTLEEYTAYNEAHQ